MNNDSDVTAGMAVRFLVLTYWLWWWGRLSCDTVFEFLLESSVQFHEAPRQGGATYFIVPECAYLVQ